MTEVETNTGDNNVVYQRLSANKNDQYYCTSTDIWRDFFHWIGQAQRKGQAYPRCSRQPKMGLSCTDNFSAQTSILFGLDMHIDMHLQRVEPWKTEGLQCVAAAAWLTHNHGNASCDAQAWFIDLIPSLFPWLPLLSTSCHLIEKRK